MSSTLTDLECSECGKPHDSERLQTVCTRCGCPLLARYDLELARRSTSPAGGRARPRGIWRWEELLPERQPRHRLTLGEGDTPLVPIPRLAGWLAMDGTCFKDESGNPTGSFKARGPAVALSCAAELEARELCIPTAGNASAALAAYASRAGLPAWVFMPSDAPQANQLEIRRMGAELVLVEGLIGEAGRLILRTIRQSRGTAVAVSDEEILQAQGQLASCEGWLASPEGAATWAAVQKLRADGWLAPDQRVVLYNTGTGPKYL